MPKEQKKGPCHFGWIRVQRKVSDERLAVNETLLILEYNSTA